jgi:hypothetical protein
VLRRNSAILKALAGHEVDFVVVGGVAAVLHGAPVNTWDLDVVHSTSAGNVARLLAALGDLDAYYRLQPELRLRATATHLMSGGHQLLMTRFGPLDLLGTIAPSWTHDDLAPHSATMDLGDGLHVRVLSLEMIIRSKEAVGSDKDRAVLPILRQTLSEKSRS